MKHVDYLLHIGYCAKCLPTNRHPLMLDPRLLGPRPDPSTIPHPSDSSPIFLSSIFLSIFLDEVHPKRLKE
jgi:hypothetical protein